MRRTSLRAITGIPLKGSHEAVGPPNETGYECWLRYRKVDDPQLLPSCEPSCSQLVAPGGSEVLVSARDELVKGIGALLRRLPAALTTSPREGGYLAIGTTADPRMVEALTEAGVSAAPPQATSVPLAGSSTTHQAR